MKKLSLLLFAGLLVLSSCSDDEEPGQPTTGNLNVNISGLENLGSAFAYEGWVIVDGAPVSTGTFSVDANGALSQTRFEVATEDLEAATMFVLSIEPVPDNDPAPAATKLLAGMFASNTATLSTSTVGADFGNATGNYIIAAPTGTGAAEEEFSGIWFLDNSTGAAVQGLNLPALEPGWAYEGWVVVNGTPVTTGTFTNAGAADDAAPFSGMNPGPPYPGEDFLVNAPTGLTFPTDLRGGNAVISIEPVPDNDPAPFVLKPLLGSIPMMITGVHALDNNTMASFPSGTVTR